MKSCLGLEAVPITCAPRARAIWTANDPTPPAAPLTSTVSPARTAVASIRHCQAVRAASGTAPALTKSSDSGLGATKSSGTATYSA